jgi:signal peptidase
VKGSPENLRSIVYIGPSMNPTLQNLDKLFYAPYSDSEAKRGDVVVFDDPDKGIRVIHRVIAKEPQGFLTRGDNNSKVDSHILSQSQILGRVIFGKRKDKQFSVHGGFLGNIQATKVRSFRTLHRSICLILERPYRSLSGRMRLPVEAKVLAFQRPEGKELQLIIGGMMVGRLRPGEKWQIRPPFRLFLDESSLPKSSE